MRKFWLLFAQAVTVAVAVLFAISVFRPDLLPWQNASSGIAIHEVSGRATTASPSGYGDAAGHAIPSVVNVFTSKEVRGSGHPLLNDPIFRHFFGRGEDPGPRRASNLGSGVIVSTEGYILTNHHVVEAADEIQVALADGRQTLARVVGSDPETDLAVLKVDLKGLPAITFGQSDKLRVGDVVLAIGNPFGVGQTVTMGIVSALGRSHLGINTFENFIQTDAAINPGNSGGALTDASGHLVGINSAIYSRTGGSQGIGFAIPVALAKQIMEQIIRDGSVTRGWLGVEVQDLTPELAESFDLGQARGALISGVLSGGPANRAGIRPGDLLVSVQGKPVEDSSSLLNLIAGLAPGTQTRIVLQRGGQRLDVVALVQKRPVIRQEAGE